MKIPKSFEYLTILTDPNNAHFNTKLIERTKEVLDNLAINKIISETKISEETVTNIIGQLVKKEKYEIKLTEDGKKLFVGETGDDYLISKFDLGDIQINNKEEIGKDTLKVTYHIGHTVVYKTLYKFCLNAEDSNIENDINKVILVKKDKDWLIVY